VQTRHLLRTGNGFEATDGSENESDDWTEAVGTEPQPLYRTGGTSLHFHDNSADELDLQATIVVVETDPDVREQLCRALPEEPMPQAFGSLEEADGARLDPRRPALLVLGPSQATEAALERAGAALEATPGTGAVLVVDGASPKVMRAALRAGISDALDLASVGDHLAGTAEELVPRLERDLARRSPGRHRATDQPGPPKGFLATVFSPKGGVGKSVIAINLAAAIAQQTGEPVVLVDLDMHFGDVAVMLRLRPRHTFADAASAGDLLDEALLQSFLARHEKSGVHVLASPTSPSGGDFGDVTGAMRVLQLLREMFPYVVVDTPSRLSELVLQSLVASDAIVCVVGMDVPSVKDARLGLQAFDLLQVPRDRVTVVLNRSTSKVHLEARDIETALEASIDFGFPSEVTVPQSVNQGQPALVAFPRSRFAAAALELSGLLLAKAPEERAQAR
jgi:pilus assembly protein CpaE